jgi:protein-S-isoprenylcysteine O-methyltransferase Ste14
MMSKRRTHRQKQADEGLPFSAVVLGMAGFLFAYLFAEAGLDPQAHPIHWLVAGGGAILGVGAGWLWHWLRKRIA